MTGASDVPLPKWSVSLALGAMVVVIGACAPSGPGADRDTGAKPTGSSSNGVVVCEPGQPGQPGEPGQPGYAEPGRSGVNTSDESGSSGSQHEAITTPGEPGYAEPGQPGEAGQPGQPGSCSTR